VNKKFKNSLWGKSNSEKWAPPVSQISEASGERGGGEVPKELGLKGTPCSGKKEESLHLKLNTRLEPDVGVPLGGG